MPGAGEMRIRDYEGADEGPIVALSLRAWEPVFESLERHLGADLLVRLRGDWRRGQEEEIRAILADPGGRAWVAEDACGPVGWVAASPGEGENLVGEIEMIAVDPEVQGRGIGAELTEVATSWLGERGMRVAMVETGGDSGHAPARRVYEKAGFVPLPAVRYFRVLEGDPGEASPPRSGAAEDLEADA
jgi:GNAT superfamily N-acetyltransferase